VYVSFAPSFGAVPTRVFPDTDEEWSALLSSPQVGPKETWCIRPAQYFAGAHAATALNVECLWGALYDIDSDTVPSWDAIAQALEGIRFVIWTTWSSFATFETIGKQEPCPTHSVQRCPMCRVGPRYRLYVPYSRAITPAEHHYVWHSINALLENIADGGQANIDRLGFGPGLRPDDVAVASQNYRWAIHQGPRLDPYVRFGNGQGIDPVLLQQVHAGSYSYVANVPEPDRTDWYDDAYAFQLARTYFRTVGPGIMPGGRHAELFKIGCKLWWDFWLPVEGVRSILQEINLRFPQSKSPQQVDAEVEASFERTRGRSAVKQQDQNGVDKEPGCLRKRPAALNLDDVIAVAAREKRSHDVLRREIGDTLMKLGPDKYGTYKPIGNVETRDRLLRLAARFLGESFPDHDAAGIVALFTNTVMAAHSQDPWQVDAANVQQIVVAAQDAAKQHRDRRREEERTALSARIKAATAGERSTVYSQEEVNKFADDFGATLEQWEKRWTIVHGGAHYLFVNGKYKKPVETSNFVACAVTDLAAVPGINMHRIGKNGELVPLDRQELVIKYGTIAREAAADMTAQRSYYDAATDTFIEATCPIRNIMPEYIPEVAAWLESFNDPRVQEWIAYATILDEPLSAIYLHGPPGAGKTLFAEGLARLFSTRGATKMATYFENFNADVASNPILLADDSLPDILSRKNGNEKLREVIVEYIRSLRRKHMNNVSLRGCFRFIFNANNDDMLPRGSGFMTNDDTIAVAERILYVPLSNGPARYLNSLPLQMRRDFIHKDLFAKHALWLRDNRPLRNENRLAVSGSVNAVVRDEAYSGLKGDVLHWLYEVMAGKSANPHDYVPVFEHTDGRIYLGVNASIVFKRWEHAFGIDRRRPDFADLRRATKSLRNGALNHRAKQGANHLNWTLVPLHSFVEWASVAEVDNDIVDVFLEKAERKQVALRFDGDGYTQHGEVV